MIFEELFEASNWQPVEYKDKMIRIGDTLPVSDDIDRYQIIFESVNSDWEQGIFIECKGANFIINDEEENLNGCYFWFNKTRMINTFKILKKNKTELKVWNIWRIDKGPMSYGHNGAALYFEEEINGKRFYCNDGYPDDDFDDLIFQINWIKKDI